MKTYNERTVSILQKAKIKRRNKYAIRIVVCSALVLIVTAAAVTIPLLKPYDTTMPSVEPYASSDYYSIIEKLNIMTYEPPQYKNAFEEYILAPTKNFLANLGPKDAGENFGGGSIDYAPIEDGFTNSILGSTEKYEEVTDNQVAGVIEGDRIKRSSEYIYYMNGQTLSVYSIEGLDSKLAGSFTLSDADGYTSTAYADELEMFLSSDCKTITLIHSAFHKPTSERNVVLINLDVSDPANIQETHRIYLTGSYVTARLVDGDILLVSNYNAALKGIDFSDPTTFVPQYGTAENKKCIDAENIISPEELTTTQYTTICKIDGSTLEAISTAAFLSYSDQIYVSENNIYASRTYTEKTEDGEKMYSDSMTEISAISYNGEALEPAGSVHIKGYLENQYSMDEYEGILRVVTTTDGEVYKKIIYGPSDEGWGYHSSQVTNANLYCIDTDTWEIAASVEQFAPQNETVQSVRFDKDAAYVCTAVEIELTDPVFYFDLSDLNNITYKDTGTITGYSLSLVNFGDYLLGIGYGDSLDTLKIELYQETETGVASITAYEVDYCDFSTEYKSYYIDRNNLRLGLGYHTYGSDTDRDVYVLLQFDGYEFVELLKENVTGNNDYKRAVYIDGYLYMFGDNFIVREI